MLGSGSTKTTKQQAFRDHHRANEYDFSGAERGMFHRPDVVLNLPIYPDPDVREYLTARAKDKGVEVNRLVNDLLKRDIDLIETVK
jgi:hypothetical protein